MSQAVSVVEHVNVTVSDPEATAEWMKTVFGWHIRWKGKAKDAGVSYHVGGADSYIAIYRPAAPVAPVVNSYTTLAGLNHIGVVVADLDAVEARVIAAGFTPHTHGNYEPGRRFYFHDRDGIEWEVVSYDAE